MFRSILVPLDGSIMAEQAILPAGDIARRLGASLSLAVVHPWGPGEDAPFSGTEADRDLRGREDRYLADVRERAAGACGVSAEMALLEGDPAEALAGFASERRTDLVVSTTHGRGALARALRGGVALRLAHALACPTLLLKPLHEASAAADPDGFIRIMVPLDGSAAAESSVAPALALAASRGVTLFLVQVISPFEGGGPRLADRRRDALYYLNGIAGRLDRSGARVDCRVVTRPKTAPSLVSLAARWSVDLIAITTRERGEGERLLLGSVADTVVRLATMPVMVCHPTVRQPVADLSRAAAASSLGRLLPAPVPA
ncbi:MAG TPA: universal stress protein [Gemmatimonadales bacterium]|nr:universal stress protein [Gemmatimonadales bacterium]